jgi:hypothetical protein
MGNITAAENIIFVDTEQLTFKEAGEHLPNRI